MTREWKPGDVGVNVMHGYRGIWVDDCGSHDGLSHWHNESGYADGPEDIRRPLVVIDPEDEEQLQRLGDALYGAGFTASGRMQTALRSLIADPKPEEPTGLGAVVEDAEGGQWIRYGRGPAPWMFAASSPGNRDTYPWLSIAVVRVLSEGVTP